MKKYSKLVQNLALIGQLGLTILTPPLLLTFLGLWLQRRYDLGAWVVLCGIIAGLISSCCGAWDFYKKAMRSAKKQMKDDAGVSFDRHD